MKLILLALRNLTRQKRRSFLLGGALAFGFLVLTMVNGCAGGVSYAFEKNISSLATGHLFYIRIEKNPQTGKLRFLIPSDEIFNRALERSGIRPQFVARRTQAFNLATMIFAGKTASRSLDGIDWNEDRPLRQNLSILRGSLEGIEGSDGVVVADSMAKNLGFDVGDRILIQTLTIDGQQNLGEYEVRAIYRDTAGTFQVSTFLDREALNKLIGLPVGSYNTVGVVLDNIAQSAEALERLHRGFAEVIPAQDRLVSLQDVRQKDFNKIYLDIRKQDEGTAGAFHLIAALEDQAFMKSFRGTILGVQWGSAAVVYFLLILIMVGLVNTFRLIVQERRREIGTLRALGMHRREVLGLFLMEASLLAVLGALAGFLVGVFLLWFIGLGENLWVLPEIGQLAFFLIDRRLAWQLNWGVLAVSTLVLVIMTLLAAGVPARKAAALQPAEALRQ